MNVHPQWLNRPIHEDMIDGEDGKSGRESLNGSSGLDDFAHVAEMAT